jgi:hypothetical protein
MRWPACGEPRVSVSVSLRAVSLGARSFSGADDTEALRRIMSIKSEFMAPFRLHAMQQIARTDAAPRGEVLSQALLGQPQVSERQMMRQQVQQRQLREMREGSLTEQLENAMQRVYEEMPFMPHRLRKLLAILPPAMCVPAELHPSVEGTLRMLATYDLDRKLARDGKMDMASPQLQRLVLDAFITEARGMTSFLERIDKPTEQAGTKRSRRDATEPGDPADALPAAAAAAAAVAVAVAAAPPSSESEPGQRFQPRARLDDDGQLRE